MRVSEAFEAFEIDELRSESRSESTIHNYKNACNSLLKSIGSDIPSQLLAYNHILKWKKDMYDDKISGGYMAQQLLKLRRILTYMQKHGFQVLDPSEIKIPAFKYRETAWLTIEEIRSYLSAIESKRDKALFALQFSSGARISELLSLNRDSIINGSAEIIGKGGIKGTLEFDATALRLLDEYLETRTDRLQPLFISNQNRRIHITRVIQLAHKYAKDAGIEKNVTTHVFRHSFASNLEINGMDIYGISKQLRHSKIETTRIYLHASGETKKSEYAKYHTTTPI